MAEFMSRNDPGCAVVEPCRDDTSRGHGGQSIKGDSPKQHDKHDWNSERMQVNDDVVSSSLLEGFGGARGSQK